MASTSTSSQWSSTPGPTSAPPRRRLFALYGERGVRPTTRPPATSVPTRWACSPGPATTSGPRTCSPRPPSSRPTLRAALPGAAGPDRRRPALPRAPAASDAQELGAAAGHRRGLPAGPDRRRAVGRPRPPGSWSSAYAATADQFLTIAKLRAARRLWARVAEVCGASRRPRGSAAARGDLVGDDDRARPVGEHAAHHGRLLRRRRRRRRRGHRAALRRSARPARRRSPAGSPATPRRILLEESHLAPGRSTRPAAPGTSSGSPTTWPAPPGTGSSEIERAGGHARGSGRRPDRRAASAPTWAAPRGGHRPPRASRSPGSASSRTSASSRWRAAAGAEPARRRLPRVRRAEAFEALRARSDAVLAATGDAAAIAARHPRARRRAHRAVLLRHQPVPGRRDRDAASPAPVGSETEPPDDAALAAALAAAARSRLSLFQRRGLRRARPKPRRPRRGRGAPASRWRAGRASGRGRTRDAGIDDFVYTGLRRASPP